MERRCIPLDVVGDILSRVPGRSLMRFRCVCKGWNSLFNDSHFVKQHLNRAAKNPSLVFQYLAGRIDHGCDFREVCFHPFEIEAGEIQVVGSRFTVPVEPDGYYDMSNSCNGLISFHAKSNVYVANPCTREAMALPKVRRHAVESWPLHPVIGLGMGISTGNYKLVRMFRCGTRNDWRCEVLTLGTDHSWRLLGDDAPPYPVTDFVPAYMNGTIYWSIDPEFHPGPECILSFDVDREKFTTVGHPPCRPGPYGVRRRLFVEVVEGCVCLMDWRLFSTDWQCYFPTLDVHVLKDSSMWAASHNIHKRVVRRDRDYFEGPRANMMFPMGGFVAIYDSFHYKAWRVQGLQTGEVSSRALVMPTEKLSSSSNHRWPAPIPCAESIVPIPNLASYTRVRVEPEGRIGCWRDDGDKIVGKDEEMDDDGFCIQRLFI